MESVRNILMHEKVCMAILCFIFFLGRREV